MASHRCASLLLALFVASACSKKKEEPAPEPAQPAAEPATTEPATTEPPKAEEPAQPPAAAGNGAVEISPGIYKVLAESDSARLLLATWKPGESDEMHSHPEFIAYSLTDSTFNVELEGGEKEDRSFKAGDTGARPALAGHKLKNIGDTEAKFLLLERKAGAPAAAPEGSAPSASEASPDIYTVVAEAPWGRLVKARWKRGASDKMHSHPEMFIYALTDLAWSIEGKDGAKADKTMAAGEAKHSPPNPGHIVKNTGKGAGEALIFELLQ